MTNQTHEVDVCIVGGGPAGMVLGLLLAKQGIKTLVLERHRNFDREYRGEVLMPQFTQMLRQINLFEVLEKYPHLKIEDLEIIFHNSNITKMNMKQIAPEAPFALWMPQPILLEALQNKGKEYPDFDLWFNASAHGLIEEEGKTVGVQLLLEDKPVEVRAKITVGTDGRASTIRRSGNFEVEYEDYSFDVMWFSIPRPKEYLQTVRFFLSPGRNYLILPKYPDLLQVGLLIPRGGLHEYKQKGIESLKKELLEDYAILHPFANELKDFSPFNVLQARINYVKRWAKEGCLLVGDAAHTCSPAGAIGVSIAVGTAIVAADIITQAIRANDFSAGFLDQVQKLRGEYVKGIQKIQKRITGNFLTNWSIQGKLFPFIFFILSKTPILKHFQRKIMVLEKPLAIDPSIKL